MEPRQRARITRRRHRPVAQVYVHVSSDMLAEGGSARIEKLGPVLVDELSHVVGHANIRLTPVVYVNAAQSPVDGYEIPERIRQEVICRDRFEVFPWSSREARHLDLDHTDPYRWDGTPGQTRPGNLGPLARKAHRAKTHAGWQLTQPEPGTFGWRSPRGQFYEVGPGGTRDLTQRTPLDDTG
ncbi:MAG: hypothetical protein VB093_05540 [Propionicimonas sp.]|nr:hypothetical protein [Propionicimonas sp.]